MIRFLKTNMQIENKKDPGPYLDLPATKKDLENQGIQHSNSKVPLFSGPYTLSNKDSFQIETFVCSTKLTHNGKIYSMAFII